MMLKEKDFLIEFLMNKESKKAMKLMRTLSKLFNEDHNPYEGNSLPDRRRHSSSPES